MEQKGVDVEKLLRDMLVPQRGNSNANANFHVNAGGVGVWIATTCCMVMIGVLVVGALWTSSEFARINTQLAEARAEISTTQTYLSAIYQELPQLKPKEQKKE